MQKFSGGKAKPLNPHDSCCKEIVASNLTKYSLSLLHSKSLCYFPPDRVSMSCQFMSSQK